MGLVLSDPQRPLVGEHKLMDENTKKRPEEATQTGSTMGIIDPPSPIRRHVKWKMARTKKTGQMTYEAAKEIIDKIDLLTTSIGRPEHPGSSSMPPEELEQLTQQIRDQLEESITKKVTQQLMLSFNQMQSQLQSQIQSHGLARPLEPEVGPSTARVSTKGSCVDPSPTDPETGDSDKCRLYIEDNPSRLVALGRVYEGSTMVVVSPAKPPDRTDHEVDDPLYLMTLTIPQLFLKPLQVMWDVTVFGVFNQDFLLYIKHEDLSEIAHGGQCLSISVIQLWIFALKGLDDTPQPKSKAGARWIVVKCNRQKRTTECGYYVMHWMSTIILGTFRNNWETYFNDVRPLEVERLKALRIQWAQYYLKVRNQT
ncbi:hypothetical protein HKD37_12G034473 [Glycine soja]|nr:hypothetical protein GmHk_12G035074 [Glycine max]KAH1221729.1 hypothetical protein GmHk_12G035074 [Glycine max]